MYVMKENAVIVKIKNQIQSKNFKITPLINNKDFII